MLSRLRDLAVEVQEHRAMTRDIKGAIAAGDREAADTFKTSTLSAAVTRKGMFARGAEVAAYAKAVIATDGNADRYHRTFPPR